ncbi:MAG: helix-turn-helix domain-containing protein [Burkholderiaceae bacterium]|nr:helix-turn-helix domain-containing protein [Burkholderiaceae bacterium]
MRNAGYTSQSALARAAVVSQSAVNRILKGIGSKGPDTATIAKLAAACGVTPEYLISGIESQLGRSAMEDKLLLIHVTPEEARLITLYRESTLAGQSLVREIAQNAPKQAPPLTPPPANNKG